MFCQVFFEKIPIFFFFFVFFKKALLLRKKHAKIEKIKAIETGERSNASKI